LARALLIMSEVLIRCIKEAQRGMLWKIFKVGKWVVIADLSLGVLINAAWAFGLINPLGWGHKLAAFAQATLQ
jgi:hypothetical protein